MTQNLHVCTIYFRLQVVDDVISGLVVKTVKGNPDSFRDIQKSHFVPAAPEADIDDSIKRNHISVSLAKKNCVNVQ